MPNERLRSAIAASRHSYESVASTVGVDPKTVARWVSTDRPPHRRHRSATSELLGLDEDYLWPSVLSESQIQSASQAELVHMYPNRGLVPIEFWRSLIQNAEDSLDFLAIAALFLADYNPAIARILRDKARNGTRVRILLADPDGSSVALRGREEGLGAGPAERVRMVLRHLQSLADAPDVQIRLHDTTLYASIFRSDSMMLVNMHVYGSPGAANPVMHLQRVKGGRIFDTYHTSFETVWNQAKPYVPRDVPAAESVS